MARKVSEADLEIAAGTAKHARMLERFVKQEGTAALPVLEQCVNGGSKKMAEAAWGLMAGLDPSRAERAALAVEAGRSKKDRKGLFKILLRVATPACLRKAQELTTEVLSVADLETPALLRAFPYFVEELARAAADALVADARRTGSGGVDLHRTE